MEVYAGIDVGKNQLDVYLGGQYSRFDNTTGGIKKLIQSLKKQPDLQKSIFEATGGYEIPLQEALSKANLCYHKAHPNKVRSYAESRGTLAKTDCLDAKLLADYGKSNPTLETREMLTQEEAGLKAMISRREQLIEQKIREENRLDKSIDNFLRKSIKSHVKWLEKAIKEVEQAIKEYVNRHEAIKETIELYDSIPGVGLLTAASVLVYLPELGANDYKSLSALVGVAPMNKDSGMKRGKRKIQGGRATIRRVLYMASLTAIRTNLPIKAFYQRLRQKGKSYKVAIVAVMRKLVAQVNSIAKRGTPWQNVYKIT